MLTFKLLLKCSTVVIGQVKSDSLDLKLNYQNLITVEQSNLDYPDSSGPQ